jgi:type II secretory pathway pseudopilin PulG
VIKSDEKRNLTSAKPRAKSSPGSYDWFDHVIAIADKPLPARRDMTVNPGERIDQLGWRYTPLMIAAPALHKAIDQRDVAQTAQNGSAVMLAIDLYRARHGNYPQSLDQLTPDVLEQLPEDRLSGKPFGYRLLDDDPHSRGYLLYSFGPDAADNNGSYPEDKPFAAFKDDEAQGNDYVFNRPPE